MAGEGSEGIAELREKPQRHGGLGEIVRARKLWMLGHDPTFYVKCQVLNNMAFSQQGMIPKC